MCLAIYGSTSQSILGRHLLNISAVLEAPAIEADSARVQTMFDANAFGLFNVVTAFAPLLIAAVPNASSAPTIVHVVSVLVRIPPFTSAYNASKAAMAAYSDTHRLELGPFGIRVVTLFMGAVSTRLMDKVDISFKPDSLYIHGEFKFREGRPTILRQPCKPKFSLSRLFLWS